MSRGGCAKATTGSTASSPTHGRLPSPEHRNGTPSSSIEDHERSPRRWYGGAVGFLGFDGNIDTGLTLRTVRVKDGVAEVRAGAALVCGSDPDGEEAETRLKASALLDAITTRRRHPRSAD